MHCLSAIFALLGWSVDMMAGGRPPLQLKRKRTILLYRLAAAAVNLWTLAALWRTEFSISKAVSWTILANILFLMTATDLLERMVYNIHLYLMLLGGVTISMFTFEAAVIGRYIFFLLLFGILFLVSRKKKGLGSGDSRVIACMALYFPFSQWMEIMLLALGSALLYGVAGILRKKKSLRTEVPFMPFMLFGTLSEFML